jgi:2-keto-4-pentenoate hydratase
MTFRSGSRRNACGRGIGADVMGHPHNALAWLANNLAARGTTLRDGEIVLTGSLVQTVWLSPDDRVLVHVSGLGSVTLNVRG